jgi:hypothetical protein
MAPVTFCRNTRRPVRPYYVSPWQGEKGKVEPPVLVPLRGDFFCLPFGGNAVPWRGETHTAHGETATAPWKHVGAGKRGGVTWLTLSMRTRARRGTVTKRLALVDGHDVVYCMHLLEGFSGKMPLGHHATLALPEAPGAARLAVSRFRFGRTNPALFSDPAAGEYQSLAINARFTDLRRVPDLWKGEPDADCSAFPRRTGFTDLLAVFAGRTPAPAWTTLTVEPRGYLWFSLKDPAILPAAVVWISNRGRHAAPWNGRNVCLGLEDVCAYFADGLAPSVRPNILTKAGVPTAVGLSPRRPLLVPYIQGVVRIPRGFRRVRTATFGAESVTFVSESGRRVTARVHHAFLKTAALPER